ncbi:LrgB family protein [Sabulicella glaciei]|uniref:LrgB family protein n=1 Tax=Sabulicella glaciei TaxID=2984948 RepID=A0ABT3NY09_9PROT|nr:LrgB family protein [Roseococcus sp. MDT2-1-1]
MNPLGELWVYLSREPLAALTATLCAWWVALRVQRWCGGHPLANPVLLAVALLAGALLLAGIAYRDYFAGAQFVHFLLGPATVALAVPLARQWAAVRARPLAILAAVGTGSLAAILSGLALGWGFGGGAGLMASLAPRATTAPVAMGVSEALGGLPSLTAVIVICCGVVGAALGPLLLTLLGVRDMRARGLALGTASHGIGTARALSVDAEAGAFSALAMGLNALGTALLLPLLWRWLAG